MRKRGTHAAIAGVGASPFSYNSERSETQLAVDAVMAALRDAGLRGTDLDGICCMDADTASAAEIGRRVGCEAVTFLDLVPYGGGGCCATIQHAALAVTAGAAQAVACVRAMNGRSGARYGRGLLGPDQPATDGFIWSTPFGLHNAASWMAMFARRYMHEHGATSRDFGRVAVQQRAYAATNPAAILFKRPLTLEEHQASPWVSEPIRRFDCCLESDGAVALLVTTLDRARELGVVPVVVAAAAHAAPPRHLPMSSFYEGDITAFPEARTVAQRLWRDSGYEPADMHAAILYDHFTPSILLQLEAYGFCGRGDAAAFVADGNLALDGALPTNMHGGLLGEAYVHGMNGIAEAVRQVRGTACNQVPDLTRILVTSGIMVPTSGLVLVAESELESRTPAAAATPA